MSETPIQNIDEYMKSLYNIFSLDQPVKLVISTTGSNLNFIELARNILQNITIYVKHTRIIRITRPSDNADMSNTNIAITKRKPIPDVPFLAKSEPILPDSEIPQKDPLDYITDLMFNSKLYIQSPDNAPQIITTKAEDNQPFDDYLFSLIQSSEHNSIVIQITYTQIPPNKYRDINIAISASSK